MTPSSTNLLFVSLIVYFTPQTFHLPSLCCHSHPWFVFLLFTDKSGSLWKRTTLLFNFRIHPFQHLNTLFCYSKCLSASEASTSLFWTPYPLSFRGTLLLCISTLSHGLFPSVHYRSFSSYTKFLHCPCRLRAPASHLYLLSKPFLRIVSIGCF